MRVSTLLEEKGATVATIRGDATVADAVAELCRLRIGALEKLAAAKITFRRGPAPAAPPQHAAAASPPTAQPR